MKRDKKKKHHYRDAFSFCDPNVRYFELSGGGFTVNPEEA